MDVTMAATLLLLAAAPPAASGDLMIHRYKRLCYVSAGAARRHSPAARLPLGAAGDLLPAPGMCTHVVYTHVPLAENGTLAPGRDAAGDLSALSAGLGLGSPGGPRLLVSVGGPATPPAAFAALARSDALMFPFVTSLIRFLREHDVNGVEVDWQYPADVTGPDQQPDAGKSLLIGFLAVLQKAVSREAAGSGRSRLLLSVAVGGVGRARGLGDSYNMPVIADLVDWVVVRTCDYHSPADGRTGMNSPLYPAGPGDTRSMASTISSITSQGVRPDKLVVTLCAKGSTYTLISDKATNIGEATSGPGIQGPFVQELGTMAYFEVCVVLREKGTRMWQNIQKNPYVVRDRLWVGYDDTESVTIKADWVVEQQLGGAALWSLDLDDFRGQFCKQGKYPLGAAMEARLKRADRAFFNMEPTSEEENKVEPGEQRTRVLSAPPRPALRDAVRRLQAARARILADRRQHPGNQIQFSDGPQAQAQVSREQSDDPSPWHQPDSQPPPPASELAYRQGPEEGLQPGDGHGQAGPAHAFSDVERESPVSPGGEESPGDGGEGAKEARETRGEGGVVHDPTAEPSDGSGDADGGSGEAAPDTAEPVEGANEKLLSSTTTSGQSAPQHEAVVCVMVAALVAGAW